MMNKELTVEDLNDVLGESTVHLSLEEENRRLKAQNLELHKQIGEYEEQIKFLHTRIDFTENECARKAEQFELDKENWHLQIKYYKTSKKKTDELNDLRGKYHSLNIALLNTQNELDKFKKENAYLHSQLRTHKDTGKDKELQNSSIGQTSYKKSTQNIKNQIEKLKIEICNLNDTYVKILVNKENQSPERIGRKVDKLTTELSKKNSKLFKMLKQLNKAS